MSNDIRTVAVIGAGQMGGGIAQVCAQAGFDVRLSDAELAWAESGKSKIAAQLERAVGKGRLSADERQSCLDRIEPLETQAAVSVADLVIEAISEDPKVKRELFITLDKHAKPDAILASNTSSISISRLAGYTSRAERVAGMHFMNPVPVMKLVEVVQGLQSSADTIRSICDVAERLGKTVVLSQDRPGFIVNRVLIPMLNEACFALQEGVASVQDIDQAVHLGLNHPMGPLRLSDLIGLDTVLAIAEVLHRDFGDSKYRPAALLRNLVAAGYLGNKSGRGFYLYEGGKALGAAPLPGIQTGRS